jgi:poly-gamma-glutamate capsule biosynthesis protein CapA/YwtB (metallophosphatase superfamily)
MFTENQMNASQFSNTGWSYVKQPFRTLMAFIQSHDFALTNLETVVVSGKPKGFPKFSAPAEFLEALVSAGFRGFITANNHCYDQGASGIKDTILHMGKYGVARFGTFRDERDRADQLSRSYKVGGVDLVCHAMTEWVNGEEDESDSPHRFFHLGPKDVEPGLIDFIENPKNVKSRAQIMTERFPNSLKVLGLHSGYEYGLELKDTQQGFITAALEGGANIAWNSHPHEFQGVFRAADGLGVFSLGNLLSAQATLARGDSGALCSIEVDSSTLKILKVELIYTGVILIDVPGVMRQHAVIPLCNLEYFRDHLKIIDSEVYDILSARYEAMKKQQSKVDKSIGEYTNFPPTVLSLVLQ